MKNIILEDCSKIAEKIAWDEIDGKDILITGASGLLGTWLLYTLYALRRAGGVFPRHVYAVIHHAIPEYLKVLEHVDGFRFIHGSLEDYAFSQSLPDADFIIHAGGYGQPLKFLDKQMEALKINIQAMFSLVDKLRSGGKLLFISSCSVYSGGQKDEYAETDIGYTNTDHPRICYIEGKRCGEAVCNICRNNGIDAKAIRLSFTYGPGVRRGDARAMYSFIEKARAGDIHMLDDGSVCHPYCYIGDAVEMLWNAFLHGKEGCYNIASREEHTIREVAELVAAHYGVNVCVPENSSSVPGTSKREKICIDRICNEFPKTDFVPLAVGLQRTMNWYDMVY